MTGAYVYNPGIWPPLAGALLTAAVVAYTSRRRYVPGASLLGLAMFLATLYMCGVALEVAAVAPATKVAWFKLHDIFLLPAVTAGTSFALEYVFPGRWLTRRTLALLVLPPLLYVVLGVTGDGRLMWRQVEVGLDGVVVAELAPAGTILASYLAGLGLLVVASLLWLFAHSPLHRWPAAIMLMGQFLGRGLYVANLADAPLLSPINLTVSAMLSAITAYAIALFGFRILDPQPIARQVALEQMRDGMVVFNAEWRVVSVNAAAAAMLCIPTAGAHGKTMAEILPGHPDLPARLAQGAADLSLGHGRDARHYALAVSPLHDFRKQPVGQLLTVRDETEQRRTQAQLVEQQQMLAALQEREHLAQELHDSLSQSLGFVNVQAQAAQVFLKNDQAGAALAALERLGQVSRNLQGDMRELIGNLLTQSLPTEGFCATLRQIVAHFEQRSRVPVRLEIDGATEARCSPGMLPADAGVQLVRIVQEALTNVRKHAGGASQVDVALWTEDEQLRLAITDNGAGFDPEAPAGEDEHFGLRVMRRRAASIGAQLSLQSAPGQGTRVEVCVPLQPQSGAAGAERSAA